MSDDLYSSHIPATAVAELQKRTLGSHLIRATVRDLIDYRPSLRTRLLRSTMMSSPWVRKQLLGLGGSN